MSRRQKGAHLQVPEDQLRNHDTLLLMHLDGDPATAVIHGDLVLLSVDCDFDRIHRRVIDLPAPVSERVKYRQPGSPCCQPR